MMDSPGSVKVSDHHSASRARIGRGAIGILRKGPRLLVIRRAKIVACGGTWCFPGGHVEPHETPRHAVVRELAEELAIEVQPIRRLGSVRVPETGYVLAAWIVRLVSGSIRPKADEIAEVRWSTPRELRALKPALASNERVLALLKV